MKVICIEVGVREPNTENIPYKIEEGKVYEVIGEGEMFSLIHQKYFHCYTFKGMEGWCFASELFIPLSDFDENLLVCLNTKPNHKKNSKSGIVHTTNV